MPPDGVPELRVDVLTGRVAIVAPGRATRPHTAVVAEHDDDQGVDACPFCPGHEERTPPETARVGPGGPQEQGWRVRVVPNLYPIVAPVPGDNPHAATGVHEVVVLSPAHDRSFGQLDDAQAVTLTTVLRDRVRLHLAEGHEHATAIVNHRRAAGASIAHPHAQVLALDVVPPELAHAGARAHEARGDLLAADQALAREHGTIVRDDDVVVWCPYGSTTPSLVRLAVPGATATFADADDDQIAALALALRDVLAALGRELGNPAYNVVVVTGARSEPGIGHWYVEVIPRRSVVAGFEQATGVFVVSVPPEQAAAMLRG